MQNHQLTGFSDADEFIILDGIPHYKKTGNTYMETIRAGLSLEDIIDLNSNINQITSDIHSVVSSTDETVHINEKKTFTKHIYDVADISDRIVPVYHRNVSNHHTYTKKKGLMKNKTRKNKINIRNSGYNWKLFKITQELGECVDIEPQPIVVKKVKEEDPYVFDYANYMEDIFLYNNRHSDYFEDDFDMYLDEDYDFDIDVNDPYTFVNDDDDDDEERERQFRIWARTRKYMSSHRM